MRSDHDHLGLGIRPDPEPDVVIRRFSRGHVAVMLRTQAAQEWWEKALPSLVPTHLVVDYTVWE